MGQIKEFGVSFQNLTAPECMATARQAEAYGFGTYWVPEDYVHRGAFSLASAIAACTSSLRIGIGVLNPYTRHPVLTAMELGSLEEISAGRAVLGMGASVAPWIEGQLGIPYAKPATSMREGVEIIRALFRGEAVTYTGQVFQTTSARFNFQPPRPDVPIHLGVLGPQNLTLAGQIADGALLAVLLSPAYVRYAVECLRRGTDAAGKTWADFEVGGLLTVAIAEDAAAAREAVKPFLATWIGLLSGQPEHPLFSCPGLAARDVQRFGERFAAGDLAVDLVTDWMIDTFAIAGDPEHCRRRLAALVDAGLTSPVAFEVPGIRPAVTLDAVKTHLMPHFL